MSDVDDNLFGGDEDEDKEASNAGAAPGSDGSGDGNRRDAGSNAGADGNAQPAADSQPSAEDAAAAEQRAKDAEATADLARRGDLKEALRWMYDRDYSENHGLPPEGTAAVAAATMRADVMNCCLVELQEMEVAFRLLDKKEQEKFMIRLGSAVEHGIRAAVQIMATQGRIALRGEVKTVKFGESIQCTLDIPKRDAHRHQLSDQAGKSVLVVITDATPYIQGALPAAIGPQVDLPFTK